MNETMTIGQFAQQVGVAPSTLRYYEREGLLPSVPRDGAGRRVYDETLELRTQFLIRLRSTGMPIRELKAYVKAIDLGPPGDEQRMELLEGHRTRIRTELSALRDCLKIVERKLEIGCQPGTPGAEGTRSDKDDKR